MDITKYEEGFYILDDGRVREFLITGEEEALLIDTGFADSRTAEEADKPAAESSSHSRRYGPRRRSV